MRTPARYYIDERGNHQHSSNSAVDYVAVITAYERVHSCAVGIMRGYSRLPVASWRDGLLMDLLARA